MSPGRRLAVAAFLSLLALVSACGSARRGPPLEPVAFTPSASRGQSTFMIYCNGCHPRGQAGLGFALNNKPLPRSLIAFQVRKGLGAMPAFPPAVISDAELDDLTTYLLELRRGGRAKP